MVVQTRWSHCTCRGCQAASPDILWQCESSFLEMGHAPFQRAKLEVEGEEMWPCKGIDEMGPEELKLCTVTLKRVVRGPCQGPCRRRSCCLQKCSRCKTVEYCSRACQKSDWHRHKQRCQQGAEAALPRAFLQDGARDQARDAAALEGGRAGAGGGAGAGETKCLGVLISNDMGTLTGPLHVCGRGEADQGGATVAGAKSCSVCLLSKQAGEGEKEVVRAAPCRCMS